MPRVVAQHRKQIDLNLISIYFFSAFIYRLQVVLQALRATKPNVLMSGESQLSDRPAPSEPVSVL